MRSSINLACVDALGLSAAAAAALCYGVATVLQARAARRSKSSDHVDPRLLIRLFGQVGYMVGIAIDLTGFVLSVLALRSEPLYIVQAIVASNLAVTALLVAVFYRFRLTRLEWAAIGAVCIGLALLGISSGREGTSGASTALRYGLLAGTLVLAAVSIWLARAKVHPGTLGAIAGLGYSAVAVGARTINSFDPLSLITDPAAWALVVGAVIGTLFFATALQRGRVTTVTATMTVAETVVPAVIGVAVLGDTIRHGSAPLIIVGFLVSLAGTLALARFGDVPEEIT